LPGLAEVEFGVEVGAFAEIWPVKPLRLRAELRQGIGAHSALTGDLAADLVWRRGNEGAIFTAGPRLRWGSAKYNRAYFGVTEPGTATLAPFDPGPGVYAIGVIAGLRLPLGRTWGVYSFVGYDRLTGRAADSPVVAAGNPNQFSCGMALTYRFGL
jgi:outer membrane protein